MINMKRKIATPTPAPVVAERQDKTWLAGRIATLGERGKSLLAEDLRLTRAGVKVTAPAPETREAAIAMANGQEARAPLFGEPQGQLAAIIAERATIRLAIEILEDRYRRADIAEAGERWAALEPEYNEQMRQLTWALVAVKHCLQRRDEILRAAKPHLGAHPGSNWPLCGRLADRDSPAQRWVAMAVQQKWLTKKEHDAEIAQAKAARGEKK
jgi:hypothetical protein